MPCTSTWLAARPCVTVGNISPNMVQFQIFGENLSRRSTSVGSPFNLNPVQFTFPSSPPHCSSVQFISREFSSLQSPVQSILLWFISEEVNRGFSSFKYELVHEPFYFLNRDFVNNGHHAIVNGFNCLFIYHQIQ